MSPAQFYAATLREVDAVVRGYRWRQQEHHRSLRYGAWHAALYHRIEAKKFPDLKTVMALPRQPSRRQTPEEQEAIIRLWQVALEKKFGKAPPRAEA